MQTAFTRAFGIEHPIIQAGMGGQAGAELVAAVSNAGALGTLGTISTPPDRVRAQIDRIRELTGRPFAMNLVTFLEAPFAAELLDLAIEMRPPAVTISFGNPVPALLRLKAEGIPAIVQVQTMAIARKVLEHQPAALVVQGGEAGGHTGSRGLFSFLGEVLEIAGDVPIIAAGGIANGRGLAGVLAMGGAGVVMGTRFKATVEFNARDAEKQAIVQGSGDDTIRDPIVDVPVPFPWPNGIIGRLMANQFTSEWLGRESALRERAAGAGPGALLAEIAQNPATSLNWAGESAGMITELLPAAEVVRRTMAQAEALLAATAA